MASMFALTLAMSFDATRGTAMASHLESLIAAKTKIIDDLGKADLTKTVQLPKDRQEFDPINAMILKHNKIAFDITVSQANLHEWARCNVLLFWCSAKIWSSTYPHGSVDPYNLDQALGTLSALVTIVLPALYGALGAMAGQIRETYQRVKQNTLMPRHAMLFFTPWLLGCVAGGTVGLFFAPSGADAGTAGGLTNSLKLAPSALSFLAGFSAESVFEQLDGLVRRVFGRDTTPTPPAK